MVRLALRHYSLKALNILALVVSLTYSLSLQASEDKLPLTELQRFTTVIEHIKNYYVKPVDDKKLLEDAIRGMLSGLDPHSAYLDTEEFAELKATTSGKFGGLGIEIVPEDGFIRIVTPLDETPAQRAGLQAGDLIIRIDDTPVRGLSVIDAVDRMRGAQGTHVMLTIIRQGEAKPLRIDVMRDIIKVQSIRSRMLDEGYGYMRITQFQSNSGDDAIKAIQQLKKKANGKLKGLVLDLRNNPGGVLDGAVRISSLFLDREKLKYDRLVVYTKGRLASTQLKEKAIARDMLNGAPVIVLINGGSASASEIVAAALQDHRRAVIMGTKSFGKGSVQTVLPMKDKRGLKLTTALYYSPAGHSIQAVGVTPDILVENIKIPKSDDKENTLHWLREEDLQGHLENGSENSLDQQLVKEEQQVERPQDKKLVKKLKDDKQPDALINSDYQLYEALNMLKGMTILKHSAADVKEAQS